MLIYNIVVFLVGLLLLTTNVEGGLLIKMGIRLIGMYLCFMSLVQILESHINL